jgi:hypothetical protein
MYLDAPARLLMTGVREAAGVVDVLQRPNKP